MLQVTHPFPNTETHIFTIHDTFSGSTHLLSCRHRSSDVHHTFELDTMDIDDGTLTLGIYHTL